MNNLKSLTKDERGKVYAKVFALMIKKSREKSYGHGFCDLFEDAVDALDLSEKTNSFSYVSDSLRDLRQVWPEMADIKPKTNYRDPVSGGGTTSYWWANNRAGRITRIKKMQWVLKEHYGIAVPIPEGI